MKPIHTTNAPQVVGPYAQAIVAGGFVFCSGQIGLDPQTNILGEGIEQQTHQAIQNLKAVLEEAGSTLEQIVKTTIFVKDMNDYKVVNDIYGSYFADHKPARATIQVAGLPMDALIEIEAVAVVNN